MQQYAQRRVYAGVEVDLGVREKNRNEPKHLHARVHAAKFERRTVGDKRLHVRATPRGDKTALAGLLAAYRS